MPLKILLKIDSSGLHLGALGGWYLRTMSKYLSLEYQKIVESQSLETLLEYIQSKNRAKNNYIKLQSKIKSTTVCFVLRTRQVLLQSVKEML